MNSKSNRLQKFWLLIACAMVSLTSWAQSFESTGTVVDAADKSPIPGVAVMVKGTTVGTVTDFDGKFSIKANQGDILILSFVGYKTVEVAAAPNMNLTLETDALDLEDVVVIGYGVARKTDLTGSVTAIKPDEKNKGLVTNPQDMIQGKIAGVNVTTNSGTPGAGASIRIRGGSSLNASNSPLIVIDGLAMDNNGVKGLSNPSPWSTLPTSRPSPSSRTLPQPPSTVLVVPMVSSSSPLRRVSRANVLRLPTMATSAWPARRTSSRCSTATNIVSLLPTPSLVAR